MLWNMESDGILANESANFASMEAALGKFSLTGDVFA